MITKGIKTLTRIVFITLLLITTMAIINKVEAYTNLSELNSDTKEGTILEKSGVWTLKDNSLYCINHGFAFRDQYTYYKVIEKINSDYAKIGDEQNIKYQKVRQIIFLAENRIPKEIKGSYRDDAFANAVWYIFDEQYDSTYEINYKIAKSNGKNVSYNENNDEIRMQAMILKEMAEKGTQIKNTDNLTVMLDGKDLKSIANPIELTGEEKLGPFTLIYPQYIYKGNHRTLYEELLYEFKCDLYDQFMEENNNKFDMEKYKAKYSVDAIEKSVLERLYGRITIEVNDNDDVAIETLEKDENGFYYITEVNGLKYDQENKIEFIYSGNYYDGTGFILKDYGGTKNTIAEEYLKYTYNETLKKLMTTYTETKSEKLIATSLVGNIIRNMNLETKYQNATISVYQKRKYYFENYPDYQKLLYIVPDITKVEEKNTITTVPAKADAEISGMVWLDKAIDSKNPGVTNNIKDNGEKGMPNVKVELVSKADNTVLYTTKTNSEGKYTFTNIPVSIKGDKSYFVRFTYDGINYICVKENDTNATENNDSDANEKDRRSEFNNNFYKIEKNKAINKYNNNFVKELEYQYVNNTAILKTKNSDGSVKADFAMVAETTSTYNDTTQNVDLGLKVRELDISAYTDITSAKVTKNGETQTITYDTISKLEKDENGNPILDPLGEENVKYNLNLYKSDFNTRIDDYGLAEGATNSSGDIEIEVTYEILLQTSGAKNVKFAYYYDKNYILEGAEPESVTIDGKEYNNVILTEDVKKLTFKLKLDSTREVELGEIISETRNWVEIISYTTDEGLIDKDSAPDNILENPNEDDTDDAPILVVQIADKDRTISGYVFEDKLENSEGYTIGNGTYEDNENKINDIIVQLIEIREANGKKFEYIWQETVTGSDTVKCVDKEGKTLNTYNVEAKDGQYTFNQKVIAGNYIVRFIYGDDEYYDTAINNENILKYNGQDYKSTIDPNYNKVNFDNTLYSENSSMAHDNEARRLEQISFVTSLKQENADMLEIDEKSKLENTWMCADTSLINLSLAVGSENIKNVNFGLVQRPAAELVLEKHITGLKIEDITEAFTTLDDYEDITYFGESILAEKTNKIGNSRGYWLVQTNIEEVAGKRIDITYAYTVNNKGTEYIGKTLKEALANGKTYSDIANIVKDENKNVNSEYAIGTYLGTAYYTGTKGSNDIETSIKFQIEDYMSTKKGMKLDTTSDFRVATNTNATKNVWDYKQITPELKEATSEKQETVSVLQSKNILEFTSDSSINDIELTVYDTYIDSINTDDQYTYRSYAAQLIYPTDGSSITSAAGTTCRGMKLSNLYTVQSYVEEGSVPVSFIVPESDEYIAETVIITMDTGADKATTMIIIASITGGLAVLAVGIILIRKFVIK